MSKRTVLAGILLVSQGLGQFEAFSVKLHTGDGRGPMMKGSPAGLHIENASLRQLLQTTYKLRDFQILGAPYWIDSDRYDIEAKAQGKPFLEMYGPMFQALLAARFKLKSHRETRELPVYYLTVPRRGHRLPRSVEGSCTPWDGETMPPRGQIHALCGFFNGGISQWLNRTLEATGATMTDLASTLSANLDRIVVDQTGLAGRFDIRLEWDRKATPGARIGPLDSRNVADPANPPSADDGPSLFMAVEDQLGLRLEPGKGSVQVLVIDHVERP